MKNRLQNLNGPSESCVNCHFLSQMPKLDQPAQIEMARRDKIRNRDFSGISSRVHLACYKGVWSEFNSDLGGDRFDRIVLIDRRNSCYFLPYAAGMSYMTADDLLGQKREERSKGLDRRLAIAAIIISILALIVSIALQTGSIQKILSVLGTSLQ